MRSRPRTRHCVCYWAKRHWPVDAARSKPCVRTLKVGRVSAKALISRANRLYAEPNVGAGLLAKASYQSKSLLTDTPLSQASPLPHGIVVLLSIQTCPATRNTTHPTPQTVCAAVAHPETGSAANPQTHQTARPGAQRLGQHLARQMRVSHTMPTATLRVINVIPQPPNLRKTRQRQQEVSGPGVINFHVLKLRKSLKHLRPNNRFNICRIPRAIHHAPTENQTLVAGQTVIIEQVVAVFDAVILWQQAFGQRIAQRFSGNHLSPARHRLRGQLRHQITEVSIARHDNELGPDLTLWRMHHRVRTALDAHRRRLFINSAAQRLDSGCFTERQVQRMNVPAAHVEHAADILVAAHHFTDALLVQQLKLRVTEALPQTLLGFQMTHLLGRDGGEHTAVLQVALDIIFGDPLTNDPPTFKRHLPQQLSLFRADTALDHINVTAIAVNDLATIAPRRPKPDLGRLQHRYPKTVLQQKQGRGQPGVTGANHKIGRASCR